MPSELKTLTITNFGGPLTRRIDGDIDSGLAKFDTSWGYDPYSKPGNLTWMEQPTSILTQTGTDGPIVAMKQRTEGAINYVYAVGLNRNLYKIQINNTLTQNASFDSPSVIGALAGNQTFDLSANMVFYGATEKIFIGGDTNIQRINFDGSSGSVLGGAITTGRNRPMVTFLGRIYFGNGNNIGEIDSTELITNTAKLSPALPSGIFVKDLDVTPDGNYLQITASKILQGNSLDGNTEDTTSSGGSDSFKFLWNGIDDGVTYFEEYGGINLASSATFGDKNYALGHGNNGLNLFSHQQKVLTLPKSTSPHPGAIFTVGNVLGFASPEYEESSTRFRGTIYNFGQYDTDTPDGLFRILRQTPPVRDDFISIPTAINVSNLQYVPQSYDYTGNIGGIAKIYYSTVEGNGTSSIASIQRLWKFTTVPTGVGSIVAGVYETQTQLFSKKVKVSEVRLYTEPLVGGNDIVIDLIGSGGSVMSGGSQRFIVGTSSVAAGTDMVQFNPVMAPTYALGVRITNSSTTGVVNWTGTKLEVDITEGGK